MIQQSRRGFLTGLGAVICAPAIVRASSLMPVKIIAPPGLPWGQVSAAQVRADMEFMMAKLLRQTNEGFLRAYYPNVSPPMVRWVSPRRSFIDPVTS
jgi:hypothetical protein